MSGTAGAGLAIAALCLGLLCGSLGVYAFRASGGLKMEAVDSDRAAPRIEDLGAADLSLAQARKHFSGKSPADLQGVYEGLGHEFWNSSRNRTIVLRGMVESAAAQEGARRAVERFLALIGPGIADRNRLVRLIGSAAFTSERPSVNSVAGALAGITCQDQMELLAGVAEARNPTARTSNVYQFLNACAEKLGSVVSGEDRSRILLVAVRRACYSGYLDQGDLMTLLESDALKETRSTILAGLLSEVATSLPGALPELMEMLVQEHSDLLAGPGTLSEVPPELLRFALSSMSREKRASLLKSHAGGLLIQAPLQAVQFAREFKPDELSPEARASVARALLTSGGEELRSWIDGLSPAEQREVLKGASIPELWKNWVVDLHRPGSGLPESAKAWLVASRGISGFSEEEVVEAVGSATKHLEPAEFEEVLSLVPDELLPNAKNEAWKTYFFRVVMNDPQDFAIDVGRHASNPEERAELLRIAATVLALRAPAQAATWLEEFPDDQQLQEDVRSRLITDAHFPLEERSHILIDSINRLPQQAVSPRLQRGAEMLMGHYLQTDYTKAVGLLDKIQNSALRESLTTTLVKQWAAADPITASEWISGLPPGSIGDPALLELVTASKDDPEIALMNATAISDSKTRVEAAMKVIEAWKGVDEKVIMALLNEAEFPESERKELEKAIHTSQP